MERVRKRATVRIILAGSALICLGMRGWRCRLVSLSLLSDRRLMGGIGRIAFYFEVWASKHTYIHI